MVPSNSVRGKVCLWEALWSPPPRTKGKEGGPSTQTATLPSQQWACLLRPRPALGGVAMGGRGTLDPGRGRNSQHVRAGGCPALLPGCGGVQQPAVGTVPPQSPFSAHSLSFPTCTMGGMMLACGGRAQVERRESVQGEPRAGGPTSSAGQGGAAWGRHPPPPGLSPPQTSPAASWQSPAAPRPGGSGFLTCSLQPLLPPHKPASCSVCSGSGVCPWAGDLTSLSLDAPIKAE